MIIYSKITIITMYVIWLFLFYSNVPCSGTMTYSDNSGKHFVTVTSSSASKFAIIVFICSSAPWSVLVLPTPTDAVKPTI